jgi:hypothetical protein
VVARDPNRPKASHIDDLDVLHAVHESSGAWPGDDFPSIPGKVMAAKLAKLHGRGLLTIYHEGRTARYVLTAKGKEAMSA